VSLLLILFNLHFTRTRREISKLKFKNFLRLQHPNDHSIRSNKHPGCLLLRIVYTSSMFTHLNAKPSPTFYSLYEQILQNTAMDLIATEGGLVRLSLRHPLQLELKYLDRIVTQNFSGSNIRGCYPSGSASDFPIPVQYQLIKNLSQYLKISCEIHFKLLNDYTSATEIPTGSRFETFALSYDMNSFRALSFAVFSGRNTVEASDETCSTVEVFSKLFRHSLEDSFVKYLAFIDASGLRQRLNRNFKLFRENIYFRRLNEKIHFGKKWNFFSMLYLHGTVP